MKRRCSTLLCLLLIPLLLGGCRQEAEMPEPSLLPAASGENPPDAAALPEQFVLPWDPETTLDPLTCPDGMQRTVGTLLYEGLFELTPALTPQARLCQRYSYDPETFTYTLTLRTDISFSDGSPLTSADAAAALKRAKTSPRYGSRLVQVQSVTAAENDVVIVLYAANAAFPALLDIPIVKDGTQDDPVPLGTGAYLFDAAAQTLRANPLWWDADAGLPAREIGLSSAKDRDTMLYQFTSRQIQLITSDLTGTQPASVAGSIHFADADTTILQYLGINTLRPPFTDPLLRQAVCLGLDRETVVNACLSGHGAPTQFPVSPKSPLYPSGLDTAYSYDAFAAAMADHGYANGAETPVTLLVNQENAFKIAAANQLADTLSGFDLKVEVQALPWEEYTAALAAGEFDLYYGEVKLTADWDLRPLVNTGGILNYGGFTDAQTDLLLAKYAVSGSASDMEVLCRRLHDMAPIVPISFKSVSVLTQNQVVDGLTPTAANPFYDIGSCRFRLREPAA